MFPRSSLFLRIITRPFPSIIRRSSGPRNKFFDIINSLIRVILNLLEETSTIPIWSLRKVSRVPSCSGNKFVSFRALGDGDAVRVQERFEIPITPLIEEVRRSFCSLGSQTGPLCAARFGSGSILFLSRHDKFVSCSLCLLSEPFLKLFT